MTDTVRILLVHSRRLLREGLTQLMSDRGFSVVGAAETLPNAYEQIARTRLGAELVLFELPPNAHIEWFGGWIARLRNLHPSPRTIALSEALSVERLSAVVGSGVDGLLMECSSPSVLCQSIRLVMTGEKVFPIAQAISLAGHMRPGLIGRGSTPGSSRSLSCREGDVLCGVMAGRSNKQIANDLRIAEATVKVHLKSILKKINARNRTQAAIWATTHGVSSAPRDPASQENEGHLGKLVDQEQLAVSM